MNQKSTTISAVILAKNEEVRIKKSLESLMWADEIMVVDNGSTDETTKIAKKHGAKIVEANSDNFSELRDIGKKAVTSDWVVYVDADEIVPDALRKEILNTISSPDAVAYFIRRKNYYLGQLWPYQDKLERLFLRSALVGWHGKVHETPIINGMKETLVTPLVHYTHRTLEEMVEKTNQWSEIEAQLRIDSGHPPIVWWRLFRVMIPAFFESYITQGGWKAGTAGWIESMYQGYSIFITYAKLWEKQHIKK